MDIPRRRSSHDLDQCSHGVGLLLGRAVRQVPAMRRCGRYHESVLIYLDVDLEQGPQITVAVAALLSIMSWDGCRQDPHWRQ